MAFIDSLKLKGIDSILKWRSRQSLILSELALGDYTHPQTSEDVSGNMRVAIVQMRLSMSSDVREFTSRIYTLTRRAVVGGARLIVFPEDTGTHLLGLLPGVRNLLESSDIRATVEETAGGDAQVADIFRLVAPATSRAYHTIFSTLAARFGVYIIAGSIRLPITPGGPLNNVSFIYGPEGKRLLTQAKTHLFPFELGWGLQAGEELRTLELTSARIAVLFGADMPYWEPAHIATSKGAEIIVSLSASPTPYNPSLDRSGAWARAQESPAYYLSSVMIGDLANLQLRGRSAVYAPIALTTTGDGLIAQAEGLDREEVILADLDLAALRAYRQEQKLVDNMPLYQRYFPSLYGLSTPTPEQVATPATTEETVVAELTTKTPDSGRGNTDNNETPSVERIAS